MVKDILDLYIVNKRSIKEIAKILDISKGKVAWALKNNKVQMRRVVDNPKYQIDSKYFNSIDSEEKSYFLGFLYADGCNHGNGIVTMSLQESDKHILERFTSIIKTDRPLYFRKKQKDNHQNQWILHIKDKTIGEDLIKLGMKPRKSLTLEFPNQIPKHLLHHFIRGYFDGDGTITQVRKSKQFTVSLCASKNFAYTYRKITKEILDINISVFQAKNNKIHYASIGGGKQVLKFLDWIYQEATIFLDRKKNKYLDLKSYFASYQKPYSSKYTGVYYYKNNKKFGAYCTVNKLRKTLGMFENEKDAAEAYNKFVTENALERPLNIIPS